MSENTSRITVGPDWLQNQQLIDSAWGFTRDELLGVDDFRNVGYHFGEGNFGRAALSAATGATELGLTLGALGLSPFTGGGSLAGRVGAATLRGGAGRTLAREGGGRIRNRLLNFATSPSPRGPFGTRPRQALLTALAQPALGGRWAGSEEEAAAAAAEEEDGTAGPRVDLDWDAILAGLAAAGGGGAPRVSVPRGMFNLSETGAERAMLARQLAEIDARSAAGEVALRAGWGEVQTANSAAADKARSMVAEVGDVGAAYWTDAAERARNISAEIAGDVGGFEGRAGIDISPTAGSENWVGFMESQAPAERRFAERQQEILGEDLDWMAGMSAQQAEAQVGDLQRQAQFMSFQSAQDHNARVMDRINQERMILAQMEMQAQSTNAQLAAADRTAGDPYRQFEEDVMRAITVGDPGLLVAKYGISLEQAEAAVARMAGGLGQLRALQT